MRKALIFDLDNTIYPVSSIADNLFGQLFGLLENNREMIGIEKVEAIKEEMTRRPFQYIADKYGLTAKIREGMEEALRNMSYDLPMQPFEDYHSLKNIPLDKYLVTTGYPKLQYSKIRQLGIENDFKETIIVDPDKSSQTKKDVFAAIIEKYGYQSEQLLVIGDDPASEIKAALELGIDTFLFDPNNIYGNEPTTHRSDKLTYLLHILH